MPNSLKKRAFDTSWNFVEPPGILQLLFRLLHAGPWYDEQMILTVDVSDDAFGRCIVDTDQTV